MDYMVYNGVLYKRELKDAIELEITDKQFIGSFLADIEMRKMK